MFRKRQKTIKNVTVVGVTGGIGCGKTTVASVFEEKGARLINADHIGHDLIASHQYIKRMLYEEFGEIILDEDRNINRVRLANIIFADHERLVKLNSIVHPILITKLRDKIKQGITELSNGIIVVDAALIVECKIQSLFDEIILLESPKRTRIARIRKERGYSVKEVEDRIKGQLIDKEKEKAATYVISNTKTLKDLRAETFKLVRKIKKQYKLD